MQKPAETKQVGAEPRFSCGLIVPALDKVSVVKFKSVMTVVSTFGPMNIDMSSLSRTSFQEPNHCCRSDTNAGPQGGAGPLLGRQLGEDDWRFQNIV